MKKFFFVFICVLSSIIVVAQESDFDIGYKYYQKGDYKTAYSYLKKAAEFGDFNAQYFIGFMYQEGQGVEIDHDKAIDWYRKAANQGHIAAQANLGFIYMQRQDYQSAFLWTKKAADQGNSFAQGNLGWMYDTGNGVTKNINQAIDWYEKAANQDHIVAQANLGFIYMQRQDYQSAFLWTKKAADQGNSFAQGNLGWMYDTGNGVTKNINQAIDWYEKAANQGSAYAQTRLGDVYGFGQDVEQDFARARDWYIKAAAQNDADAQCKLGELYDGGYGVKQDYSKAFELHLKSAEKGEFHSQYKIGYYYYSGKGISKNLQKAEYWSKKAIESNKSFPYPYSVLALIYAERDKNYPEALRFSDLAISNVGDYSPLDIYGERGQIYVWQGDMENAEKMLAKCIELNPDYLKGDDEFSKMMASYHSNEVDTKIITNPTTNKNTFAIIIGNEKYKNEEDVPFAKNDAKIFEEYVEKTLGVPHDQIRYIENAGYNDLRIAINWLIQAMTVCRGNGKAIVYYAGHGIPDESDLSAYLLPVDGIGNDPGSAYSLKDLYDKLGNVEAQSVTIFLDACFSGSRREGGMLASARGVALKAKPGIPKGNMVVFSAAQGNETAYPYKDKQHGMFTYFLLKKLQETKGNVALGELSDYLVKEVGRESFVKNGKMQTPTTTPSTKATNWRNWKLK